MPCWVPCGKLWPVIRLTGWTRSAPNTGGESQAAPGGMGLAFRVVALTAGAALMVACASGRSQTTSDVQSGREIFFNQCYGCHTLGGAGTPIAPDLSHVGARLSRDEIERRLRDPRTHKPDARMPKLNLSEPEVQALATYLSELR